MVDQNPGWFSDMHDVLSIIGLLLMGAMSLIGYKVHSILFNMKLPERLASLETTAEDHEKRIDKIEVRVFK